MDGPVDLESAPLLVFWETTRACSLACKHCRADAISDPLPGELSTQEARRFIESLTGFGARPPVLILTGGDVLMRDDVFSLASFARSIGLHVGMAPSVTPLLTRESIARMKQTGIKAVSISVDGARPSTHDAIRGIPGHLARTLAAVELLVQEGFRVQVNTTVMRDNAAELGDLAASLVGLGIHVWEVFFLVKVGRGTEVEELTPEENEDVCHFLYDASLYGVTVRTVEAPFFRRVVSQRNARPAVIDPVPAFSLGSLYVELSAALGRRLGPPTHPSRAQSSGTRDGKGVVFVSCTGEVHPAGFLPISLGNVRSDEVVDIYRKHPLLKAIQRADFRGRCGTCKYKDLCGGSRARAFAASGDPLGEDPGCAYSPRGGGPEPS